MRSVLSYAMPTFVVGAQQLHVWKHGLSFYGCQQGRDGGLAERYPHLDDGRGTLELPTRQAVDITDGELRAFRRAVLSTTGAAAVGRPPSPPSAWRRRAARTGGCDRPPARSRASAMA